MDVELLSRARIQEIEREISHIRLAAAAESAKPERHRADPDGEPCASMPLRVLRALRQAV